MAFKMKGFDPGEGTGLNAKRKLPRRINKRVEATNTISKALGKTNTLPTKIDYEFNPTMKSNKNEGVNKVNYKPKIKPQKLKRGALKLTGMSNKQKRISKFKGLDMTNREKRITNKMSKAEKAGKYQKSDKLQEKLNKIKDRKFKKATKNVKVPEVVFNTPPSSFKIKTGNKIDGKRVKKTDTDRLEGEILGIYDNEYNEAKQDKDLKRIKQLEKRMLKLRDTVVKRGDGELFTKNKSHIDMSKFSKSPMKKHHDKKRGYDTGGFEAKEEKDQNKRRLKEVKSSIRDLRIERLKKIGNKRAQTNLKSAIAGLKEKKKQLKNILKGLN